MDYYTKADILSGLASGADATKAYLRALMAGRFVWVTTERTDDPVMESETERVLEDEDGRFRQVLQEDQNSAFFRLGLTVDEAETLLSQEYTPPPSVESPFPSRTVHASDTDLALMSMKMEIKPWALAWIKDNPEGTEQELLSAIQEHFDGAHAGLAVSLLAVYVGGAAGAGLIPEPTFEAFRAWVAETDAETLMAL